jgi:type VI protein secretion system component Hcp
MPRRRRWEERLEREDESKPKLPQLADIDEGKRADVVEELQRAGGNRAFQQVLTEQRLQRETAASSVPSLTRTVPTMRIDEIPGPSKRRGYEGLFELEQQFELEARTPTERTSGQAYGHREYSDVKVVLRKSTAITQLRRALAENKVIKEIVITTPVEDGIETTTLKKARVVGVKDLGNGNVELRFVFHEITWDAGSLSASDEWSRMK